MATTSGRSWPDSRGEVSRSTLPLQLRRTWRGSAAWTLLRSLPPAMTRLRRTTSRSLRTPTGQILLAVGGMLGGAALISRLALGLMLIVGCLLIGVDGLLREAPASREEPTLPDAVERWRRSG